MSDKIEIKDIRGSSVLSFSDFRVRSTYKALDQIFISFRVTLITTGGNISKYDLDAELSDFEEMLDHLEILNHDLKRTFYFQHSDERIKVKFTPNDLGLIKVEGLLASSDYSTKTEFKFETDQSFLGGLIENCKRVISKVRVESLN